VLYPSRFLKELPPELVEDADAILDRFLHHAQVIAITGKSYRVKEAPGSARKTRKVANQTNLRPPGPRAKARSSAPARSISQQKMAAGQFGKVVVTMRCVQRRKENLFRLTQGEAFVQLQ